MQEEIITNIDNKMSGIDIFGSWIEVGMVIAVIVVGALVVVPPLVAMLKKRKCGFMPTSKEYREAHSRIHEFATEVRVKMDADRACILQFHNGGRFLDGSSMKKFSLTHESCTVGVTETRVDRKDVLVSTFIEMLEHLATNNPMVEATSSLSDCHFKRHLESNHTLAFSLVPIKDVRGVLVLGCLLVEWCNWDNIDVINDDITAIEIPKYARLIESQIANGARV